MDGASDDCFICVAIVGVDDDDNGSGDGIGGGTGGGTGGDIDD